MRENATSKALRYIVPFIVRRPRMVDDSTVGMTAVEPPETDPPTYDAPFIEVRIELEQTVRVRWSFTDDDDRRRLLEWIGTDADRNASFMHALWASRRIGDRDHRDRRNSLSDEVLGS